MDNNANFKYRHGHKSFVSRFQKFSKYLPPPCKDLNYYFDKNPHEPYDDYMKKIMKSFLLYLVKCQRTNFLTAKTIFFIKNLVNSFHVFWSSCYKLLIPHDVTV